jgi:hypothetical protein
LLYAGGGLFILLIRLPRVLRDIRRSTRRHDLLPLVLPPLVAGLVVSAVGEITGYAFGAGEATEQLVKLELYKARYVRERDRQTLEAWSLNVPE